MAQFYDIRSAITSITLPAAGATLTSDSIAINTYAEVTPLVTYTRNGAGGAVNLAIEISVDNITFFRIGESQSAAIVAGTDVIVSTQRSSITYTSTAAGAESVTLPTYTVVANYIRVLAKETGAVGTPGKIAVDLYLRGNQ